MIKHFEPEYHTLDINYPEFAALMGYGQQEVPEPFHSYLDEVLAMGSELADIKASVYFNFDPVFDRKEKIIQLEGRNIILNSVIYKQIRSASAFALFLCTAGSRISTKSKELTNQGESVLAYIYDLLGSLMVEKAMDEVMIQMQEDLPPGYRMTNRYSPGYCYWALDQQKTLFSFFPEGASGIYLTPSCLMQPLKSISGIIGLGPDVQPSAYQCNICEDQDCLYKNLKATAL
ncbi:MAG: hypothetical protein ACNS62_07545 [Candidatus Cyclobacteriaceae bacterium M3_2C_046]